MIRQAVTLALIYKFLQENPPLRPSQIRDFSKSLMIFEYTAPSRELPGAIRCSRV